MYRGEYDSYHSDDEKRVELIRNMLVKVNIYILCNVLFLCSLLLYRLLTIVEQVSEMKEVIGERLVLMYNSIYFYNFLCNWYSSYVSMNTLCNIIIDNPGIKLNN